MDLVGLLERFEEGDMVHQDSVALFFRIYPEKQSALGKIFEVEDSFSQKQIRSGLLKKLQELRDIQEQNSFQVFLPSDHQDNPINIESLPEELRSEYALQGKRIRMLSQLQARLSVIDDTKVLTQTAGSIVKIAAERRATFIKVDTFLDTGKVITFESERPVPIDKSLLKNFEIEYELKKLMSRKSKCKGKPEKIEEFNDIQKQINELRSKRYL